MIDDRVDVDEPNNAVSELSAALRRRVDRVGRFFLLMAVGLVVWVVYLAIKLPGRRLAVHYDIAWVGFDSGLAVALLLTGALVIKRSPHVVLPAAGTAALLLADAWSTSWRPVAARLWWPSCPRQGWSCRWRPSP